MKRPWAFIGLVTVVCLPCARSPVHGQTFRLLAFGDSITLGNYDFDNKGGYPGRLHDLLDCSPGICDVYNGGKSGEQTSQAVSRIDSVLSSKGPFDVMLLMEGTNDIFSNISVESIKANLRTIANKARNRGVEPVHASIIWFHPDGEYGTSKNDEVQDLRNEMASLAQNNRRYFVDIWDELCPASHPDRHGHGQGTCFNQHYSDTCPGKPPPCGDNRGHPIGSGYDMMAARWFESITAAAPPARPTLLSPSGVVFETDLEFRWNKANRANWYQLVVEGGSGTEVDIWLEGSLVCASSVCSHSVSRMDPDEYTWKVRGRSPAGFGSWSDTLAVTLPSDVVFQDSFESGTLSAWSAVRE